MKQKILFILLLHLCCITHAQTLLPGQELPDNIVNACSVNPPATTWSIREVNMNKNVLIQNYGALMVGDIDNDGIVEIVAHKESAAGVSYQASAGIKIFYYSNITGRLELKNEFLFSATGGPDVSTVSSMALARYNNTGYIIVAGLDNYLYAYDSNGNRKWKSNAQYQNNNYPSTIVNIADFNGDGVPEVYTGNQIFSLATGILLCDGGTSSNSGAIANMSNHFTVAADMNGDGQLELVAGTDIYQVTITNNVGVSGNSITLISDLQLTATLPTYALKDGATQVVDIDNDGILEVVVTSENNGRTVVYVWKPVSGNQSYLMGSYLVPATEATIYSIPMIGNIDDTIYPEIVFITNGSVWNMYALKFNSGAARGSQISLKWSLSHSDQSGCTGATLFDFNQDGVNEIVYRDETRLRIIDGSNNPGANPNEVKATFTNVLSGTLREFPVIADIDGDGQAEIIVSGWDGISNTVGGIPATVQNGYIRLFKTGGSDWAPARKVWNQYAYNAVNVNEDLTIPVVQFGMATTFAGPNGILGDIDDVRPFNNFMQQQTILDQYGMPLWLAPNGQIMGIPVFSYNESSDEMKITLQIKNAGDAIFQNPFYVTIYKDNVGGSTKETYTYPATIAIGETITLTFSISGFSSWVTYNFLVIKINDNGDGTNNQDVCDDSRGQYRYYGILPSEQDVCMGKVKQMTCSFTLGATDTYQWQSSKDNVTWTDISGATAVSYTPADQKRGVMYYRVEVNNNDVSNPEIINSASVRLRVRSCKLPVNHNISTMGYYD